MAISVVLLLRARRTGSDRAGAIDATIVATGLGLLSWVFLTAPAASDSDLTRTGQLVSLAYPVWDVMSFALTMRLLVSVKTCSSAASHASSPDWLRAETFRAR